MKCLYLPSTLLQRFLNLILFLSLSNSAFSQAPTGLTYPTPALYNANVSNVFLSPNVAGRVTSYSMPASPALPTGLSFDTNTGIISGMPTVALATTRYTITATNASGSTSTNLDMTITSNYLNNDNQQLHFGGTGVTVVHYPSGSTGQAAGDITLYKKITTLSGQKIDCIVTTRIVNNVSKWQAYDQEAEDGDNFSSNKADFFAPQLDFSAAGNVTFDFQFILGDSYNSTTKSGINMVLQKVKLNTYDIDGNNGDGSYQYNEFGGFQTSELLSPGTRVAASYESASGLTRFTALDKDNSKTVTDPKTRVRVSYDNMSKFTITVGAKASGLAFFFLDFSAGDVTFTGATIVTSPSVDLNKATTGIGIGVDNEGSGCGDVTNGLSMAFTIPSETNIQASPATLRQLDVSFQSGDILNGANEKLVVGTKEYVLNTAAGSQANVTVGSVEFKVTKVVASTTYKYEFTKNAGGTFTVAEAEALLDAMKYKNDAATRIGGSRKFTVNVYNTDFKSPDAVFTATVNCVAISGHIWRDANGLLGTSDFNTISANSPITGQLTANGAYAILVNAANDKVIASKGIDAGGAFSFGNVSQGTYILYVSDAAKTEGSTFTKAIAPAGGYQFIGENLGAGAGNDLAADGKLIVTVGSSAVTDANFGLDIPPVANDVTAASQVNPGGTQKVTVPNLNGTDAEDGKLNGGTGNTVKIISLPAVGEGILYYNDIAVDISNPVIQNYDPSKLKVDPVNGNVTVTFTYQEVDAAGLFSPTATVKMPFTDFAISGKVYHDADGTKNSLIDGTLISKPEGNQLYANLIIGGVVVGSSTVTDGAYSFTTLNGLQANTASTVVISTVQGVKGTTTGATSTLPAPWVSTADGSGTGDNNPNGQYAFNVVTSDITTGLDFGVEIPPVADPKSYSVVSTVFSATPPTGYPNINAGGVKYSTIATSSASLPSGALSGSDEEDCKAAGTCSTGKSFLIGTINSNTRLYYNFPTGGISQVTSGTTIPNYDPAKLIIYVLDGSGTAASPYGFQYSLVDAAGVKSVPVDYKITTFAPLPVTLARFDANKEGTTAQLTWSTTQEKNSERFDVQHSADAKTWNIVGTVAASGESLQQQRYSFIHNAPVSGTNYYRLKMVDSDESFAYSNIRVVDFQGGVNIRLYPNPVSDKLVIEDNDWASVTNVDMFNTSGSLVYGTKVGNLTNEVDVKSMISGTYILRITKKDGSVFTKKFAVAR